MPTLQIAPDRLPAAEPPRKRWTRADCDKMLSAGLLENDRLELVEGELTSKMGKKRPHSNTLRLIFLWCQHVFGERFVLAEDPIDVAPADNPINEPESDVTVLNREFVTFVSSNPGPADLLLVIKVAHSSLTFDLSTKASLYARAGIVEYWVVDVEGRRLIVHRQPQAGSYASIVSYNEDESVTPLAAPDQSLRVKTVFLT